MKKKMTKKLTLNREVLRTLQDTESLVAEGGCTGSCNCGNSGFIECQPNYTCRPGCIYL